MLWKFWWFESVRLMLCGCSSRCVECFPFVFASVALAAEAKLAFLQAIALLSRILLRSEMLTDFRFWRIMSRIWRWNYSYYYDICCISRFSSLILVLKLSSWRLRAFSCSLISSEILRSTIFVAFIITMSMASFISYWNFFIKDALSKVLPDDCSMEPMVSKGWNSSPDTTYYVGILLFIDIFWILLQICEWRDLDCWWQMVKGNISFDLSEIAILI